MTVSAPPAPAVPGRGAWRRVALLVGGLVVLTAAVFALLATGVAPQHPPVGGQVLGVGLGITAFLLGVRHAFDADHIAAIDNTTRKLVTEGRNATTTGFWFALGHASVVVLLTVVVAAGAELTTAMTDESSPLRGVLRAVGGGVSGLFLLLIGVLNVTALVGLVRLRRALGRGADDPQHLEELLRRRGLLARVVGGVTSRVRRPAHMFPVGLLFGIGFDTASEVLLLTLAGTGAASGLPWGALLALPVLFACGMCLFDTLDGAFMDLAYRWAGTGPGRRIAYGMVTTGMSVLLAIGIGAVQLGGALHDVGAEDALTTWLSSLAVDAVGCATLASFAVVWVAAAGWAWLSLRRRAPAR